MANSLFSRKKQDKRPLNSNKARSATTTKYLSWVKAHKYYLLLGFTGTAITAILLKKISQLSSENSELKSRPDHLSFEYDNKPDGRPRYLDI